MIRKREAFQMSSPSLQYGLMASMTVCGRRRVTLPLQAVRMDSSWTESTRCCPAAAAQLGLSANRGLFPQMTTLHLLMNLQPVPTSTPCAACPLNNLTCFLGFIYFFPVIFNLKQIKNF